MERPKLELKLTGHVNDEHPIMITALLKDGCGEHQYINSILCIIRLTRITAFALLLREPPRSSDQVSEALADPQPFIGSLHSIRLSLLLVKLFVQPREHDLEQECTENRRTKHCGDNAVASTVAVRFVKPDV